MGHKLRLAVFTIAVIAVAVLSLGQEVSEKDINGLVGIYSTQHVVGLELNETFSYKLKSGAQRVIRLVSVEEHRDSVTKFGAERKCASRSTAVRSTWCAPLRDAD